VSRIEIVLVLDELEDIDHIVTMNTLQVAIRCPLARLWNSRVLGSSAVAAPLARYRLRQVQNLHLIRQ
jgi:hypothetical protein